MNKCLISGIRFTTNTHLLFPRSDISRICQYQLVRFFSDYNTAQDNAKRGHLLNLFRKCPLIVLIMENCKNCAFAKKKTKRHKNIICSSLFFSISFCFLINQIDQLHYSFAYEPYDISLYFQPGNLYHQNTLL